MNYTSDFVERVKKINPDDIIKYLKASDWKELNKPGYKGVKIFQIFRDEKMYQANIPTDPQLADYDQAMCRAIEQIAAYSNRLNSISQFLTELSNPSADIIWFQVQEASLNSGTIRCDEAINIYTNAKKLVNIAALDLTKPNKYHAVSRQETDNKNVIQNCMFGPTAFGSYVMPLIIPSSKNEDDKPVQMDLNGKIAGEVPLSRKISDKIMTSIQQVKDNIDSNTLNELMSPEDNKQPPISINFLEALSAIGISNEKTEVNISAQWTPTVKSDKALINQVSLTNKHYEPINTVVKTIKETYGIGEKTIIGKISKLDANYDAEKRTEGTITVVYIDSDKKKSKRTAKVTLTKENYNLAIEAHARGAYVKVTGIISGQRIKSIECNVFTVL